MENLGKINLIKNLYGLSSDELAKKLEIKKSQLLKIESGIETLPSWLDLALTGLEFELKEKKTLNNQKSGKFTFIDLFAGIGGIRIGFEKAGGHCVFTSEWDKYPAKMYEDNFGDKPAGDITQIHAKDVPPHDILVAGFPCQPFSLAGISKKLSLGKKHGFEDETQGTLFFDVARILKYHRPKMFLLENVKNLKSHDKGNTFKVIQKTLEDLGYCIRSKVIDGGLLVPQHRERIYIVGTLDHSQPFEFPTIKAKQSTLNDILMSDKSIDPKYTLSDKLWLALQNHAEKHRAKGNGFGYGLNERNGRARTLSARYYKDGAEILISQGKNKNPRRLTPKECARLMGFPNSFKITLSDTRAYKCFGNSVVVPIVEILANEMAKHDVLKKEYNLDKNLNF